MTRSGARTRHLVAGTALTAVIAIAPASAQEDEEPGFIARQIENALSAPGREVRVRGFEGALSGRATMTQMTFADADGVWLSLDDAVLDWNRTALLRGRLSVNELSADTITLSRQPLPAPDEGLPDAPAPEASGFSLPELPVAVNVGAIQINSLELGEAILGEEALFRLQGNVRLEDGEADIGLNLARLEGPENRIGLDLAFSNETRELALDLTVREGSGGLASTLIGIPGAPSLALDIDGTGPLEDYTAVIDLSTQGVQRLAGEVTLRGVEDDGLRFSADVGGDITPVIAPDYAEFFGPDVALVLSGLRSSDGALDLEQLEITARSLDLRGSAAIDSSGQPERFSLEGTLADPDGDAVRLPAGAEVTLGRADLTAGFDRAEGNDWTLELSARALDAPGLSLDALTLSGGGQIELDGDTAVTAALDYAAEGLAPDDDALAAALGPRIDGRTELAWQAGTPLTLSALTIGGADYGATIQGTAETAERTLVLDGSARLNADDLSRFSGLAGRDLTGAAEVSLAGNGDVLGGLFDIALDLTGTGLSVGQDIADRFLEGPVTLSSAARRDLEGTYLDRFALDSAGIEATAEGAVGSGITDVTFNTTVKDVALINPAYEGPLNIAGSAMEASPGLFDVDVTIDGPYELDGSVAGLVGTGDTQEQTEVTLDLFLADLSPFVPDVSGPVSVRGTAASAGPALWQVDLAVDAPEGVDLTVAGRLGGGEGNVDLTARIPDVAAFVPGVPGTVAIDGRAEERGEGQWQIDVSTRLPYDATAALQGEVGPSDIQLSYAARLPDVGALAPDLSGALAAIGAVRQTEPGRFRVTADIDGPYAARAAATANVGGGSDGTGRIEASVDLTIPDLSPVVPALRGGLTATATATQQESGAFEIDLDADGPFDSSATAQGSVGGGDTNATATVRLPNVGAIAPQFAGALSADVVARQTPGEPVALTLDLAAPYGATVDIDGQIGQGQGKFDLGAQVPNIAPFAAGLRGALSISGTATEESSGWRLDVRSQGPGTATANVQGTAGGTGGTSVEIDGSAPLALINGLIAPQRLEGDVVFDLVLDGPGGLDALSGEVSTQGAQLQVPAINLGVENINVDGQIGGGQIVVDASASSADGGAITASGPVTLSGQYPADLAISIDGFVLSDPSLYQTTLDGALSISGPLRGQGGVISGRLDIGETELRIPSGGAGGAGAIPLIQHVAEPTAVFQTRERAGLINLAREARGGERGNTILGLDLRINAPRRIFLRGRGLDAELGGTFTIGGTTRSPAPVGAIEVIRGRLDILGKRLELEQDGRITLGGDLVPFLELLATSSDVDDFTILISISGPVNEPTFTFSSVPQLPEDEVLARFFFNQGLANLSPLQAAQLAASVSQLTGSGGPGFLGSAREGLGVDDFNVVTDDDGDAALQIGQYLTDNIYTDVTTSTGGTTEVNINIDVTNNITIKGSADNEGDSTLGIFFERDY